MSRKARIYCESQLYHIIMRGNNKQNIFYDKHDRYFFIKKLKTYVTELNIDIFAYCLMDNHIHILIGNANSSMSKLIQKLATCYAMYFNRKYDRCGHLFQGRYKSEPIESDAYFKTVTRYILQNSRKAGLDDYMHYQWNSIYQTLNNNDKTFISTKKLFQFFDGKENFILFIQESNNDICMEYENKIRINDSLCLSMIKNILGRKSFFYLISERPELQKKDISILKNSGIPINQISRITGIPRMIIQKA